MRRQRGLIFVCFLFVLFACGVARGTSFDVLQFEGPKMDDLYYVVIRDTDAQLLAMSTGKLDVLSDVYRTADVERLAGMNNVDLTVNPTFHGFFITFNTRKFPWDQTELRLAASQVVDRRRWVRDLFSGYCEPLSTFLPHISPYRDPDITLPPSGVHAARKRLADAGWTWDLMGQLVAPDGRKVPMTKILCPPSSVVATTAEIAWLMSEALAELGVPAEAEPLDFQTMLARIDARDFDAATSPWLMSRDPDVLYAFYHSSMDVEGGYNISGISDPALDATLWDLRHAPDEESARRLAFLAQRQLAELMPVIPLYSRYSISAVRNDWNGIFSTERSNPDNLLTLISMTPKEGGQRPVNWILPEEVRSMNPLVSSSAYDWTVLGTVYDTMLSVNPYDFGDIPWLAESWDIDIDTEADTNGGGSPVTVLTFTLREGLKWQDGRPLTVDDVAFTLNYVKEHALPRFYDNVKDIAATETDGRTLRVRMNTVSFWHLHNIGGMPVLPRHILEKVTEWRSWQPTRRPHTALDGTVMTELVGTGPYIFKESRTGEYVHMVKNRHYFLYKDKDRGRRP